MQRFMFKCSKLASYLKKNHYMYRKKRAKNNFDDLFTVQKNNKKNVGTFE